MDLLRRLCLYPEGSYSINDLLVHDETDTTLAGILANMTYKSELPRPVGVFLSIDRPTYRCRNGSAD